VEDATPLVVIVKVVLVDPADIVTLGGTCAAVSLLCKVTTAPPAGAAPFKVTIPVELLPPTTEAGFLVSEDRVAALTVRLTVLATP
jgi:hypothetical protein